MPFCSNLLKTDFNRSNLNIANSRKISNLNLQNGEFERWECDCRKKNSSKIGLLQSSPLDFLETGFGFNLRT